MHKTVQWTIAAEKNGFKTSLDKKQPESNFNTNVWTKKKKKSRVEKFCLINNNNPTGEESNPEERQEPAYTVPQAQWPPLNFVCNNNAPSDTCTPQIIG